MKNLFIKPLQVKNSRKAISGKRLKYTQMASGILFLLFFLNLSGCSILNIGDADYGCSGMPEGVRCMSARDVYAATNDGNIPRPTQAGDTKKSKINKSVSKVDPVIDNYVAPNLPDKPVPIRTPAMVMRIWVAPWEDTNGDLVTPGYIYTEIEPRKWVIGESVDASDAVLTPLKLGT